MSPDTGRMLRLLVDERARQLGLPPVERYRRITETEAVSLQRRLASEVDSGGPGPARVTRIAGVDTAFVEGSEEMFAAAVVCDTEGRVLEIGRATGQVGYDYIPGLLSFREIPLVCEAIGQLDQGFELVICDGHGLIHPRRFGLACHLGLLLDLPALGVGKTHLLGQYDQPEAARGSWSTVVDEGERLGRVVRSRTGVRPVFVSVGHKLSIEAATDWVVRLAHAARLPEPVRQADIEVNRMRRER